MTAEFGSLEWVKGVSLSALLGGIGAADIRRRFHNLGLGLR